MSTRFVIFVLALLGLVAGCDNQPRRTVVITSPPPPPAQQVVVTPAAPTSIMDSSALDLSTIADLLRSGRVQDAETLQATINNPENALNNVDLDGDGNIDPITVVEVQVPNGRRFNLVANPATKPATPVANIDVVLSGGQVLVQAGYPSYVRGYDTAYYSYSAARDIAFLAWAMNHSGYYAPRPITSYAWYSAAPRHVYAPEVVTQRRTTYTTQTRVSPIPKSTPPSSFTQQAQAAKVPSGFQPSAAARPAPTTNNLNDRATAQDFKVRDTSQPTQRATGFGAKVATPPPAPVAQPSPVTQRSPSVSSPSPAFAPPSRPAPAPAAPPSPVSRPSFGSSTPSRPSFGGGSAPSGPRTSPRR